MPSLAVLATWLLTTLWVMGLGSLVAPMMIRRVGGWAALRASMWFGLAILTLTLLVINFFVPLRSSAAVLILGVVTVAMLVVTVLIAVLKARNAMEATFRPSWAFRWWSAPLLIGFLLGLTFLAHTVFGGVNQWDAGLYHLNAIQYASDYRVIPGLANLHDRLGVTNSQHLLTAFLGNSGWGIDAFRLQVGFFVVLFVADITLRLLDGTRTERRSQVGTLVLLLALLGVWPFLLSNPDELIASPTPDTVALLVSLVGGAYLVDALTSRRSEWAMTALVVLALAATIRTQLWVLWGIAVLVLIVVHRRAFTKKALKVRPKAIVVLGSVMPVGLLLASQIRDAIQTGWLLFPLDLFPLPVDWKAYDPAASRAWIVSWARSPGSAPEEVNNNWSWLGGWLERSLNEWSVQLMLGLLVLAAVAWWVGKSVVSSAPNTSDRRTLLAVIPAVVALALWFFSAPDPRFAWGPLLLVGAIPAAVALSSLTQHKTANLAVPIAAGFAALIVVPGSLAALTTIDGEVTEGEQVVVFDGVPWSIAPAIEPVVSPALQVYQLPTGQELITPTTDDRCWLEFPLCRPYPNDTLVFRGDSVQDGFASSLWQSPPSS